MADFLPGDEAGFWDWQDNFIGGVTPNILAWGITAPQLAVLTGLQSPYLTAYAAANKGKKTVRTTAQNNTKKTTTKSYKSGIRAFVKQFIAFNSAITDDQRKTLGVTVRDKVRTPSTTPTAIPDLFVAPMKSSRFKVTARQQPDAQGRRKRGKPKDTKEFEIAVWIGDNAPLTGDSVAMKLRFGKSPGIIPIDPLNVGKTASLYARWIGKKGQLGPWSNPEEEVVTT